MSDREFEFQPHAELTEAVDDPMFWARMSHILEQSVLGLPEDDRAARIAWCEQTGQQGITMFIPSDKELEFHWGGRRLCTVDRTLFDEDAYFQPLVPVLIPGDASGLT